MREDFLKGLAENYPKHGVRIYSDMFVDRLTTTKTRMTQALVCLLSDSC
jgi:hypothetical protein